MKNTGTLSTRADFAFYLDWKFASDKYTGNVSFAVSCTISEKNTAGNHEPVEKKSPSGPKIPLRHVLSMETSQENEHMQYTHIICTLMYVVVFIN